MGPGFYTGGQQFTVWLNGEKTRRTAENRRLIGGIQDAIGGEPEDPVVRQAVGGDIPNQPCTNQEPSIRLHGDAHSILQGGADDEAGIGDASGCGPN